MFEKSAEILLGAEIDPLREYILKNYKIDKDMYKIKFNEFQKLIQTWAEFESKRKDVEFDEYSNGDLHSPTPSIRSVVKRLGESDLGSEDEAEHNIKDRYKRIIELKIQKHYEKIREIFENYSDEFQQRLAEQNKPKEILNTPSKKSQRSKSAKSKKSKNNKSGIGSENDDKSSKKSEKSKTDNKSEKSSERPSKSSKKTENDIIIPVAPKSMGYQKTNVKLSKVSQVLRDISYLTGLGIMSSIEADSENKPKKSTETGIDEFIHFAWLKKHAHTIEQNRDKTKQKSILKPISKLSKNNGIKDDKESKKSKDDASEKSDKKSEKSETPKKAKKPKKEAKPKKAKKAPKGDEKEIKLEESEDEESESGEGSESEGESGSESDKSDKKDKKEEQRKTTILFQDEKYAKEVENIDMAYEDFQDYMMAFVDAC